MTMVSGSLVVLAFLVVFVLSHTSQNTEASSVGATDSEDKEVHFRFPWEEIHNHNIKLVRQRKGKGLKVGTIPVPDRFQEEGLTPFQGFTPRRQFLVFTSCGDRSRIPLWAGDTLDRSFDIIAGYYGTQKELTTYLDPMIDFKYKYKHYKIPSLKFLHEELLPGLLTYYDAVYALDNDILMNTAMIDDMFATRKQYGLTIMGASQEERGKISYPALIPDYENRASLKYIHFSETNSPLFESSFIQRLMASYSVEEQPWDWGLDWLWSSQAWNEGGDMAIANWITLMNPKDSNEIGNNEQQKANMERWETFSQNGRYNIRDPDDLMVEYKSRVQVDRNIAALAHNDFYWFMTEDFDHQAVLKQHGLPNRVPVGFTYVYGHRKKRRKTPSTRGRGRVFKVRDGSGVMMKLRISEEDFEKHGLKDPIKRRAYVQQKAKEVKEDGG